MRAAGRPPADARVRRQRRVRGARRRAAGGRAAARLAGRVPAPAVAVAAAGVVLGGLGSLVGAVWGAAVLVFLPNWTNDLAHSFSLSGNVSAQPSARDLRRRADRRDAGVAERDPGRLARDRARRAAGDPVRARRPPAGDGRGRSDERTRTRGEGVPALVSLAGTWAAALVEPALAASPRHCAQGAGADSTSEQRGLNLSQPLVVAANPDRRVVVQERMPEAHDRIGQRLRIVARIVAPAAISSSISACTHATARGSTTPALDVSIRIALSRSCSSSRRRAGERVSVRLMRSRTSSKPAAPRRLTCVRLRATSSSSWSAMTSPEQRFAGSEPAVDGRAAKAEPRRDDRDVDALAVEVELGHEREHVVTRGGRRPASFAPFPALT